MYGQVPTQIRLSLLEDLSLACLRFQRIVQKIGGLSTKKVFRDVN